MAFLILGAGETAPYMTRYALSVGKLSSRGEKPLGFVLDRACGLQTGALTRKRKHGGLTTVVTKRAEYGSMNTRKSGSKNIGGSLKNIWEENCYPKKMSTIKTATNLTTICQIWK